MCSSRRARRLLLALAATSLVAAPGTASAVPAPPGAPGSDTPLTARSEPPSRVPDPLQPGDEDVTVLLLAASALAVVAAGGATLAHRRTPPFPQP